MTQGLHPLAANMINQLNRVDVVSNNLANANTTGFKGDHLVEGSFNLYLERAMEENKEIDPLSEIMNTIPKIDGKYTNQEMGSILETGNALDFALNQPNFYFKVQNSKTGNTEYTRDGSFKILNGELVTQNGYPVLDANNQPIVVDENNIFANNIGLVNIESNNLDKIGNNNYKAITQEKIVESINDGTVVLQGAIEQSNINTVSSMIGLIEAQRRFEQSQKAITSIDQINAKVIEAVGSNK